jgi:drug/metabolite transporter (DMT)-like permease
LQGAALLGAGLAVLNTLVSVSADALAKDLVASYAAPQLMAGAGLLAVTIGLLLSLAGNRDIILKTGAPGRVALRSSLGAISTVGFFLAYRELPFAEMFPFIAILPIFAAVLSGAILKERIGVAVWIALAIGLAGMVFLFPEGISGVNRGHMFGLGASLTGAASIVLSRGICRSHTHAFAQVFYAQLACTVLGIVLLPFVWHPMGAEDMGLLALYTLFLLATRWLMVMVVRLIPAHVALQIGNIQFVWMVLIGQSVFDEPTGANVWIGAALVVASGLWLVQVQRRAQIAAQVSERERRPAAAA